MRLLHVVAGLPPAARQTDELLEVLGDELWPSVGDDPGLWAWVFLQGTRDGISTSGSFIVSRISQYTMARL